MAGLKYIIKKNFASWLYRAKLRSNRGRKLESHVSKANNHTEAATDIFTDQGEDGIIRYFLNKMADVPPVFLDIGAGDCINGNCTTLAIHYNWNGVFVDKNELQLNIGRKFYQQIGKSNQVKFLTREITKENITEFITAEQIPADIGLLSIDIDGNDYWIWKQLNRIRPRLVVIESKVEFGERDLVVPYGPKNHRAHDLKYNGASVEAFRRLGKQMGYKLAGANRFGYNLFFVQEKEHIPEVSVSSILSHPQTQASFYQETFFREQLFENI